MTVSGPDDRQGSTPQELVVPIDQKFEIQIDRKHYQVGKDEMTGAELRQVPAEPIKPDRDLFEVVPGETDKKIELKTVVKIRDGKRFFTAPAHINPGRA